MKLKKIASAILALGVIASTIPMVTYAESLPTVKAVAYKYENNEDNYVYQKYEEPIPAEPNADYGDNIYVPDGMTGYLVVFSIENVDLKNATKGANTRLMQLEAHFSSNNNNNIHDYTPFNYGMVDTGSQSGAIPANDTYKVVTSAPGTGLYPAAGVTATSVPELCSVFVVVKDDTKPVTFTPIATNTFDADKEPGKTKIITNTFTGGTAGSNTTLNYADGAIAVESFTLGTAPAGTTVNVGTGVAVEAKEGKVWNDVVISNVAKGTDYVAKFTDNNGTADNAEDDESIEFPIEGIAEVTDEVNGDATFAVILKTARNLANIAMEILFQAQ